MHFANDPFTAPGKSPHELYLENAGSWPLTMSLVLCEGQFLRKLAPMVSTTVSMLRISLRPGRGRDALLRRTGRGKSAEEIASSRVRLGHVTLIC